MDEHEKTIDEVRKLSSDLGVDKNIRYLGYKKLGPELFQCYQDADIYVIASQLSEGFPRTIWEAMANSLPVVATRVGSIPYYIEGAAELVTPRSPEELAMAIFRLVHQTELRKRYIVKGFELAKSNTLEYQAEKMMSEIEKLLIKQ